MTAHLIRTAGRAGVLPVAAALAVSMLAGCSHSSSKAAQPPTAVSSGPSTAATASSSTASSSTASSVATSPGAGGYRPLSKAQLLTLLPTNASLPGWTSTPSTSDNSGNTAQDAELMACVGAPSTDKDQAATASSPEFSKTAPGTFQDISASATSYKTLASVVSDVKAVKSPRLAGCLKQTLAAHGASLFGNGLTYVSSTVKVTPGTTAPVAARIDAVLQLKTAAGKPLTVGLTEVELASGGVEENLTFIATGQPVSAAVAGPLITQATAKLVRASPAGPA